MGNIFTDLQRPFSRGNILTKLIYMNAGVFTIIHLWKTCFILFNLPEIDVLPYMRMPSSFAVFLTRPWTVVAYMFTHFDILHLLFNMLWLYWFGTIFLQFFYPRQLAGLYLLGGIVGGLLFLAACNVFPYFHRLAAGHALIGASASVMSIVFAVSFYRKNYYIPLFLLGRIKLIYLAWGVFIFDLAAITSSNAGGHIAHLGGAFLGMWFAAQMKKGKDLTAPLNRLTDVCAGMGKRKSGMYVSYKQDETIYGYHARRQTVNVELNAILDKLKRSGYAGLSSEEKKKLFEASKK
jgi:membrane associated rhomboid family serine protease